MCVLSISMAVYTPVSREELVSFLTSYDVGELVSHEGIEQGVSNTNYFVTTDKGRFVLTLFEPHRVRTEDIPFFIDYTIVLEEHGVPCPKTLIRKDSAAVSLLKDRPAALFSVLDGEGGHVGMLTPKLCQRAGETLALMHNAAQPIKSISPNHFGLKRWQDWVTSIGPAMNDIAPDMFRFCADETDWAAAHWPKDLPAGAIHADFFPDNVFFKDGDVSGVIDFHFVCTDLFAYDLAIALNAWSFDENNNFRAERMDAMMRGYNSIRPLTKAEIVSLPVLLRAAALRFLLSRIEEKQKWKPGDFMKPHDPMVFDKRLRHFQVQDPATL